MKFQEDLRKVCQAGDLQKLQNLLEDNFKDFFVYVSQESAPLMQLCVHGHIDCLKWLSTHPEAQVHFRRIESPEVLIASAAADGQIDTIRWFLTESPIASSIDLSASKYLALRAAIHADQLQTAKFLFDACQTEKPSPSYVLSKIPEDVELVQQALTAAVQLGRFQMIEYVFSRIDEGWLFEPAGQGHASLNGLELLQLASQYYQAELISWLVGAMRVTKNLPKTLHPEDRAEFQRLHEKFATDPVGQLYRQLEQEYSVACEPFSEALNRLREEHQALQETLRAPHCQAAIQSGLIQTAAQLKDFLNCTKFRRESSKRL